MLLINCVCSIRQLHQVKRLTCAGFGEDSVGQFSGGRVVASPELMLTEWHARDGVEVYRATSANTCKYTRGVRTLAPNTVPNTKECYVS